MNSSSSSMATVLANYHKRCANLHSKTLNNEEQRIQLEQKIYSFSNIDLHSKQRQQIEHLRSYLKQFDQDAQRAKQRNSQLLNDIAQAESNLNQLRIDTEKLLRSKQEYSQHLESNYPNWQKPTFAMTNTTMDNNIYNFNRVNQFRDDTDVHQGVSSPRRPYDDGDSSTVFKRDEKHTISSLVHIVAKDQQQHDDQSLSESTSNTFSRSKRPGSLRMELSRSGLYFLLDYIEKELIDTIEKKKFYRHDPPTITQKRTILDIANNQQQLALKDLDPTTTSMVILDQLPSTIRRTTLHQCLLTEDILSSNVIDLDKDVITKMLPEQDRSLWTRLIDHFTRLLKFHIMSSQTLANKFAPILLPSNVLYLHDKAKSLLKHIVEKLVGTQQSSSEDETSTDRKPPIEQTVKANTAPSSSWLNKLVSGGGLDDDDDDHTSTSSLTPKKTTISASSTPKAQSHLDDSDLEFYS